jgi:hypothetical protein
MWQIASSFWFVWYSTVKKLTWNVGQISFYDRLFSEKRQNVIMYMLLPLSGEDDHDNASFLTYGMLHINYIKYYTLIAEFLLQLDQRTKTVASYFVQATLRMKSSRPSTRYPVWSF